jgi:CspA family cold shock protein
MRAKGLTMATGTIKTIRDDRGFGFLVPEDGQGREDLFFHHTSVADGGFTQLREGQRVSFEEGTDPRDPRRKRAVNVRPLDEDA